MSSIVGMVNGHRVAGDLPTALGRLQHRGYDSAGLAVSGPGFAVRQVRGPAGDLAAQIPDTEFLGRAGIAHSSWSIKGAGYMPQAHAQVWNGVAVVHTGRVEASPTHAGQLTDEASSSDAIPRLIAAARAAGAPPADAVRAACGQLRGAYAIAVLFDDLPNCLIVARQGSPVLVASGHESAVVASDPAALVGLAEEYAVLEDGDIAELTPTRVAIQDIGGLPTRRRWRNVAASDALVGTNGFRYYTRREIAAQRATLAATDIGLRGRPVPTNIAAASRIVVAAHGSSFHAASVASSFIERFSLLPCDVVMASEYLDRQSPVDPGTVGVLVSPSGETADTIEVADFFRSQGVPVVAVVEVADAGLVLGADLVWTTEAGPERGIAATKSFTIQLLGLIRLGLAIGAARGVLDGRELIEADRGLVDAPVACALAEASEARFAEIGCLLARKKEAMFVGLGWGAPMAVAGASMLKELSHIRAENCLAGELKRRGVDTMRPGSPVIILAEGDRLLTKAVAHAWELRACGAHVIALVEASAASALAGAAHEVVALPGRGLANVFGQAVALQLIAYHAALALGHEVDKRQPQARPAAVG